MRVDKSKQMQEICALKNENQAEEPVSQAVDTDLLKLLAGLFVNNLIREAELRVLTSFEMENDKSKSKDENKDLSFDASQEASECCNEVVKEAKFQDEQERHSSWYVASDQRPNVEAFSGEDPVALEASRPNLSAGSLTVNISDDAGDNGKAEGRGKAEERSTPEEKKLTPVEEELKRLLEEISVIDFGTGHLAVSVEVEPNTGYHEGAMRRKKEIVVGERGDCGAIAAGDDPVSPEEDLNQSLSEVSWDLSAEESLNGETEEVLSVVEPTYGSGGKLVIREILSSSAPLEMTYPLAESAVGPTFNARYSGSCSLGETLGFSNENANIVGLNVLEEISGIMTTPRGVVSFDDGTIPRGGEECTEKSAMRARSQKSEFQEAEGIEDAVDTLDIGMTMIKEMKYNVCCFRGSKPDRYREGDTIFESGDMEGFEHGNDGYFRQSLENMNNEPSDQAHSNTSVESSYDSDYDKLAPPTVLSGVLYKDVIFDGNISKCTEDNASSNSPISEKEKEEFHSPTKPVLENIPRNEFLDESSILNGDPKLNGGDVFSTSVNELILENVTESTEDDEHNYGKQSSLSLKSSCFSLHETEFQVNYLNSDGLKMVNIPPEFLQFDDSERKRYLKANGDDVIINILDDTWSGNRGSIDISEKQSNGIDINPATKTENELFNSAEEEVQVSNIFEMVNDSVYLEGDHEEYLQQTSLHDSYVNISVESDVNMYMEMLSEAKRRLNDAISTSEQMSKNVISDIDNANIISEEIPNNASGMEEKDEESRQQTSESSRKHLVICEIGDGYQTSYEGDCRLDKTYLVSERESIDASEYSLADSIQSTHLVHTPTNRPNDTSTLSRTAIDESGKVEYFPDVIVVEADEKLGEVILTSESQEISYELQRAVLEKNEVSCETGVVYRDSIKIKDIKDMQDSSKISEISQVCGKEINLQGTNADEVKDRGEDRTEGMSTSDCKELDEIASQFTDPELREKILHPVKNLPGSSIEAENVRNPTTEKMQRDLVKPFPRTEEFLTEKKSPKEKHSKQELSVKISQIYEKERSHGDTFANEVEDQDGDRNRSVIIPDLKELNDITSQFTDTELRGKILHPVKNLSDSPNIEVENVRNPKAETVQRDPAEPFPRTEGPSAEEESQKEKQSNQDLSVTRGDDITFKDNMCDNEAIGLDSNTITSNAQPKVQKTKVITTVSHENCTENEPSHICTESCLHVNRVQPIIISSAEKTGIFHIESGTKESVLDYNTNLSSEVLKVKDDSDETATKDDSIEHKDGTIDNRKAVIGKEGNDTLNLSEDQTIGNNVSGNRSLESLYAFEYNTQPKSSERILSPHTCAECNKVTTESRNNENAENVLLESNASRTCEQHETLVKRTEEIVRRYEMLKKWRLSLVENMVSVDDNAQSENSSTNIPNVPSGSVAEHAKPVNLEGPEIKRERRLELTLDRSKERSHVTRITPIGIRESMRMFNFIEEMGDSTRNKSVRRRADGFQCQLDGENCGSSEQDEDSRSEITNSAPPMWSDGTPSESTEETLDGGANSATHETKEKQYETAIREKVKVVAIRDDGTTRKRGARRKGDEKGSADVAKKAGTKMAEGDDHAAIRRVVRTARVAESPAAAKREGGSRGARAKSPSKKDKSRGRSDEGGLPGRKRRRKDGSVEATSAVRKASSLGAEERKRAKGGRRLGEVEGKTDKERTGEREGWKFGRRVKNFVFSALGVQRSPKH